MKRWLKTTIALILIGIVASFGFTYIIYWKDTYPNYLIFQPKHTFQNNFYLLEMTSFITQFWTLDSHMGKINSQILAYYRMLTLEEGYKGDWTLEAFDNSTVTSDNATTQIVETHSHLWTFTIHKQWTFHKNEPYFTVTITKTYLFNSTNENNQIILDVNNESWSQKDNTFTFNLQQGQLTIEILESDPQIGFHLPSTEYPSELQLDFKGEGTGISEPHLKGQQQTVTLKIYVQK